MSRPSEQTFSQTLPVEGLDQSDAALLQQQIDLGLRSLEQNNPDMAVTFFQSALNRSSFDFPFYDHLTHNLLLAYKQRIAQLLANDKKDEAKALLEKALELDVVGLMADDDKFCRAFADTFQSLGVTFFENYEFGACLACYRRAIEVKPSAAYHVNLTNVLAVLKRRPLLSDLTTSVTSERLGRHVFIACVPKSASTFLRNVLLGLTGYRDLFSVYSSWQTEQELYLPGIVEYAAENTVTQQHCRASEANIQMMQAFNIRPVILTRNIFDAIVSMADFYRQGAYFNSYFREGFTALDEEKQVDLLIDNIAPWYLQFTASWELAEKEDRLELLWLSYEDLTQNKVESIERLLEFYGLGAARAKIERLLSDTEAESRKNRFNKGVAGRGKTGLTDTQKERIIALTAYYPATDFSKIGL
jgi:tetratricopeptide (TPR) repeat protein